MFYIEQMWFSSNTTLHYIYIVEPNDCTMGGEIIDSIRRSGHWEFESPATTEA